jgi:hypothetical protein
VSAVCPPDPPSSGEPDPLFDKILNALSRFAPAETPGGLLYHYTTAEGFLGIVNSGSLRGTSIRCMNDPAETRYGQLAGYLKVELRKAGGALLSLDGAKGLRECPTPGCRRPNGLGCFTGAARPSGATRAPFHSRNT